MNRLEMALLDPSNVQLDLYLEDETNENIRIHIGEIIEKALCTTEAGLIKQKLIALLDSI